MVKNNKPYPCPICKKAVIWNKHPETKPFCSERCKLIDLGEWFSENKRIPGENVDTESDLDCFDEQSFLH